MSCAATGSWAMKRTRCRVGCDLRHRFQDYRANIHVAETLDPGSPRCRRSAGFNFNVEEWDAEGSNYETLAICRTLALARAAFKVAIAQKPAGRFMIRSASRSSRSPS
jgi:hypothetical protein